MVLKTLLVGIDVGTTSAKTVLMDRDGSLLAQASYEYTTEYPHPNWAQQNPQDWWRAVCHTLQQVFTDSKSKPESVYGVGVSCQAPTLLAVDKQGTPLYPAMIWMDRRSEPQCQRLSATLNADLIANTNGGRIDPYYMALKLLWFREQLPDIYAVTHTFLQANGYIVQKLTGCFSMDLSVGPLTLLFDSRNMGWSSELLKAMDLDETRLPPLHPCSQIVGEVTGEAAGETGLAKGTPVIAGMVDGTAAALEAGIIHAGEAIEMTGQSTVLMICSDQPYLRRNLIPLGHAVPGKYLTVGAMVATGGSLRWFRDQLGETERRAAEMVGVDAFELLSLEASKSSAGANRVIFLPYMYGERSPIWDSHARGVFAGLSLSTTKADLIRAIMEGAAYGLRHNVETAGQDGYVTKQLSCVGGGSKSAVWNQIKADVLNVPILLPKAAIGAPLGDAMLAAVATGVASNIEQALFQFVQPGKTYQPNEAQVKLYDEYYHIYLGLYPALQNTFRELGMVDESTVTPRRVQEFSDTSGWKGG